MLDFDALSGGVGGSEDIIDPRQIFTTLVRHSRFKFVSANQGEVLEKWQDKRTRSDNTIKMNTGSGKMLVGLLALRSSLNEKIGPGVYITPDNYLVRQVVQEARDLGIAVTEDVNHAGFLSGEAILVANIDKLVNGKSVFGVGVTGTKIAIGTVVIDDAHACLDAVADQFSIDLTMKHPAYTPLLDLFSEDLMAYSHVGWVELSRGDPQSLMQVPFWAWQAKCDRVIEILDAHRDSEGLRFSWPLLKEVIGLCTCVFGGTGFQAKPRCLPIDQIPAFARAKRRIYMTATLADDGILISHLGADAAAVADPIRVKGPGEIGDRMIIAPQEVNPNATDEEVRDLAVQVATSLNVVVLVPSFSRAAFWEGVANQTLARETIAAGVAELKKKHVGLTVLVNRYDGVDLPDDACRLLIIDGLPETYGLVDRIDAAAMEGTQLQLLRQIQRLEQGMGRGVRSGEDRCAVLLLGARLTQRVNMPEARTMFTAATLAQIEMGKVMTRQIKGKPVMELRPLLDLCMLRNSDQGRSWWSAGRARLAKAAEGASSHIDKSVSLIRSAFNLAVLNQWRAAEAQLQQAVHDEPEPITRGYLKLQLAEYVNRNDPVNAQKILLSGISDNPRILRPIAGISYKKVPTPLRTQAEAVEDFVRGRFIDPNELLLHVKALLADLQWDPERTDRFEAAMQDLGTFLGFGSQRPDNLYRDGGPDNLWAVGALRHYIIECKSGVENLNKLVSKDYCNQLLGSESWFKQRYDASCLPIPILVHPSAKFGPEASPSAEMRVIDIDRLAALKTAVEQFTRAVIAGEARFAPVEKFAQSLQHFGLSEMSFLQRFTTPPQ